MKYLFLRLDPFSLIQRFLIQATDLGCFTAHQALQQQEINTRLCTQNPRPYSLGFRWTNHLTTTVTLFLYTRTEN